MIPIEDFNFNVVIKSISVSIDDFVFGTLVRLRISLYDTNGDYIYSKFVEIKDQDYQAMVTSQNRDTFIRNFVQNNLSMTFINIQ
jgi:hypothetical protein